MKKILFLIVLTTLGLATVSSVFGQRTALRRNEPAFVLIRANTHRVGATQYAEAIVSVRTVANPNTDHGMEVLRCNFTAPTTTEEVHARRRTQVVCRANWPIDSASNGAMKDFTVRGFGSTQGIGDIETTQTFIYRDLGNLRLLNRRSRRGR